MAGYYRIGSLEEEEATLPGVFTFLTLLQRLFPNSCVQESDPRRRHAELFILFAAALDQLTNFCLINQSEKKRMSY